MAAMNTRPGSEADPLDAVVEAIVQRCRRGERPTLSEYTARYPELAGRLREVFPALVIIEDLGSVGGGTTMPPPPPALGAGLPTPPPGPPDRLGDYRVVREVGRGGMGVVYEAVQESLGRHVALKVLPASAAQRGLFLERFRREARAAARLHHTNIVPVYGVGEEDGTCYYAMQFIHGEVAKEWKGLSRELPGFTIDPTFRRYARGGLDGNVSVRRVSDDVQLFRLPGDSPIPNYSGLEFSPDGRFLHRHCEIDKGGTGSRLWRLERPRPTVLFAGYGGWAFSPDGREFAAAYPDNSLRLYELKTGRELRRFRGQRLYRSQLCWNPRRPLLASSQGGHSYQLFDLKTGRIQTEVLVPGGIFWMDWHPEGRLLAVGSNGNANLHPRITLWDTTTGRLALPPLQGHRALGVVVRFNHAGDRLLSTDWDGIWRLWDTHTGQLLLTQPAVGTWLHFSPDDGLVGVDATHPGFRLFRFRAGQEFGTLIHRSTAAAGGYGHRSALDSGGRLLAVDAGGSIVVVDVIRNEEVALLPLPGNNPLLFDPSGALLTNGRAGVLRWPVTVDPKTGMRRHGPPESLYPPTNSDLHGSSTNGRVLAIPKYSQGALVLHRPENRLLRLEPQEDVRFCAVSPNGRWIATGSHGSIRGSGAKVWDARSGRHVRNLSVESHCSVWFSQDNKWLLTRGGGYRLWSVGTWREGPRLGGPPNVWGAAFTADGSLLALEDVPGLVRLVVSATGKEVARLTAPEQTRLQPLCFASGGTRLVCRGTESGALHIFDLRLIRRQLAAMGLDWDAPPYPKAPPARVRKKPLRVEFVGVDLAADPEKMRRQEIRRLTLRLWANPFDAPAYLERGRLHYEGRAWPLAYADFDLAFTLNPRLWQARQNRALAAYYLGRWRQVRADAEAVLRKHARQASDSLVYFRALACQKLGDHAQAVADLTRMIRRFPKDWLLYERRAASYTALGKRARAAADRKKAVALIPNDARVLNGWAWNLLVGDGPRDPVLALKLARKAVKLQATSNHWNTLGVAYYRNGKYRQAVAALKKSLAGRTDFLAHDLFFLAMCHHQLGDRARAEKEFARAVRWCKDHDPKLDARTRHDLAQFRAEAEAVFKGKPNREHERK
jgi:WD40 repeat protein/tetratricopeptide (TPR) repeat protein